MLFKYKAKKNLNEVVEGKIDGESVEHVLAKLQAEGLVPVYVEPNGQDFPVAQAQNQPKKGFGRWQLKQLVLFTQKLYNLVNCRVELLIALRLLEKDCRNPAEKALIGDIIKNIKDGVTFSAALSRYPQYFPAIYVNILRAGEATGRLKEALLQLLDYLRRIEDLKTKVKQALAYPIFMVVVGIGTIFVMLTFVLPRIAGMFEDFQAELPLPTRILLGISDFIKAHWFFILLFVFALILIISKKGKNGILARIKYHIPIAKDIIYKQAIANFSRSTSLLLQGGVNLLSALNDAIPLIDNPLYIKQLQQVRRDISEGKSFSDALAQFKIFPDFFVQMIRVGEEGGRLDSVLADISESYEKEIEGDLKIVSSLIEPAIILFLGLIIGAMVIAMLLPIFNMNTILGG
ncbi:MAG: type II secretion system F family protein [Candidatus Omnitrophica bacterium]|nr:type II secretion system F family protein [Candidatus Omnitrophota bacterium]